MEATARFDYETKASDELSFMRGEQLNIVKTSGNWFKAELNGRMGSVAKHFLDIHLPSWYQEDCSRAEAEEQLMKKPVGAFVIRGSRKTVRGDFSISVRLEAAVQHFKVMRDSRGKYYLWSERFPSLNQLVEYYQHTSISKQTKVFLLGPQQQRGSEDVLPSQRPLPPPPSSSCSPPTSAPVAPRKVRALYTFEAEESDELGFNTGDVISVLESSDPTWWRGALRGKSGLFPCNHTTPL